MTQLPSSASSSGGPRPIQLINYLAFGSGDFLGAGATALTGAWLLYFYTTFCGLTPIEATFIFAAARVVDAIASPLMGYLSDNFGGTWLGQKFGRRKFFIMLGIPLSLSYMLMWIGGMNYWYYLLSYIAFDVVYTMVLVPYETLVPEMTNDFKKKAKFSGARILTAQGSSILAAFLPGMLINHFGKDSAASFFYAGLIFSLIFVCVLTFVHCFTWERSKEDISALQAKHAKEKLSFSQSMSRLIIELTSTLRIRIFRQHLGMYLGGYIAQDVFNAVFTYYVVFVLMKATTNASSLMGVMSIFQFIAVICCIQMCIRLGPAPSYRIVTTLFGISTLAYAALYWMDVDPTMAMLYGLSCIAGLGRGGINYIPWNTYNYIADVDEVITGQRREGIFAGIMTLTRKTSQACAVMLVGIVLQYSGFVSGQSQQNPTAQNIIVYIMGVGTILILLCGIAISFRFKLNLRTHHVLRAETERMKAANRILPESVPPETKAIVEELAGMPYESLWGNNNIGYINSRKNAMRTEQEKFA